nr:DCC1-like thiol-disulfide oxidoreductase family protein [Thermoactinomyces sp. CICC 24226]
MFDGDCSFCDGWVRWIIQRDSQGYFRFASLQSEESEWLSRHLGVPFSALDSVILIEQGRYFIRSTAVLRILQRLPRFSVFTRLFFLIPRPLRDAVYRVAARNRHRWNRKKQTCPVPTPGTTKKTPEVCFGKRRFFLIQTNDLLVFSFFLQKKDSTEFSRTTMRKVLR